MSWTRTGFESAERRVARKRLAVGHRRHRQDHRIVCLKTARCLPEVRVDSWERIAGEGRFLGLRRCHAFLGLLPVRGPGQGDQPDGDVGFGRVEADRVACLDKTRPFA